ncbi:MAG: hypothetical protein AVDCRST_MAG07-611, partial [uncultured Frankineae bacterium]
EASCRRAAGCPGRPAGPARRSPERHRCQRGERAGLARPDLLVRGRLLEPARGERLGGSDDALPPARHGDLAARHRPVVRRPRAGRPPAGVPRQPARPAVRHDVRGASRDGRHRRDRHADGADLVGVLPRRQAHRAAGQLHPAPRPHRGRLAERLRARDRPGRRPGHHRRAERRGLQHPPQRVVVRHRPRAHPQGRQAARHPARDRPRGRRARRRHRGQQHQRLGHPGRVGLRDQHGLRGLQRVQRSDARRRAGQLHHQPAHHVEQLEGAAQRHLPPAGPAGHLAAPRQGQPRHPLQRHRRRPHPPLQRRHGRHRQLQLQRLPRQRQRRHRQLHRLHLGRRHRGRGRSEQRPHLRQLPDRGLPRVRHGGGLPGPALRGAQRPGRGPRRRGGDVRPGDVQDGRQDLRHHLLRRRAHLPVPQHRAQAAGGSAEPQGDRGRRRACAAQPRQPQQHPAHRRAVGQLQHLRRQRVADQQLRLRPLQRPDPRRRRSRAPRRQGRAGARPRLGHGRHHPQRELRAGRRHAGRRPRRGAAGHQRRLHRHRAGHRSARDDHGPGDLRPPRPRRRAGPDHHDDRSRRRGDHPDHPDHHRSRVGRRHGQAGQRHHRLRLRRDRAGRPAGAEHHRQRRPQLPALRRRRAGRRRAGRVGRPQPAHRRRRRHRGRPCAVAHGQRHLRSRRRVDHLDERSSRPQRHRCRRELRSRRRRRAQHGRGQRSDRQRRGVLRAGAGQQRRDGRPGPRDGDRGRPPAAGHHGHHRV